MFTVDERDETRERLLALAAADPDIVGAAVTGSSSAGAADEWSDVDLVFAIEQAEIPTVLERWTELVARDFGALHHWDLRVAATVYRVFLLADGLELDIAFTPTADFGPRGPNWQTIFGDAAAARETPPVDRDELIGLAWHHVLHARACIERGKPWQAQWLLDGIREYVLALACRRLGYETRYARGADRLPRELRQPLEATLVSSLADAELRRSLAAASTALVAELRRQDPQLADRLAPLLLSVGGA